MKPHTVFLFAIGMFILSSCQKLDEKVQGYFFVQNTDGEEYSLKINGKDVGVLPINNVIPLVCVDSTLVQTTMYTIDTKKNEYELRNSKNEIVALGKFKITNNSLTVTGDKDLGTTHISNTDKSLIMGFNVDAPTPEYLSQCTLE